MVARSPLNMQPASLPPVVRRPYSRLLQHAFDNDGPVTPREMSGRVLATVVLERNMGMSPRRILQTRCGCVAGVSILAALISVVMYASRHSKDHHFTHGHPEVKAQEVCALVEEDTEYHTRRSLYAVDHIGSAEMCCAACRAEPKCKAWTWGKQRDVVGLTDMCLLKELAAGEEPKKIKREGVVSGLPSNEIGAKHGLVSAWKSQAVHEKREFVHIDASETCPGKLNIVGHNQLSVVSAQWNTPGNRATKVDVLQDDWIVPRLQSRAYFAERCTAGAYNRDEYAAINLLGKTLSYTTDISNTGCGCSASFQLVSMRQNPDKSGCKDYFCGSSLPCGVPCAEIDIQFSNQYAWLSMMHLHDDLTGVTLGYGGNYGPRDWTEVDYSPGSECIDTSWPFQVSVSFPVNESGSLISMEVRLSQEGHSCSIVKNIHAYDFAGRDGLSELSAALKAGMTPVVSYWDSSDLLWMDGVGMDGKGPCVRDEPALCPATVSFYGFSIQPVDSAEALRTQRGEGSPLQLVLHRIHDHLKRKSLRSQIGENREPEDEGAGRVEQEHDQPQALDDVGEGVEKQFGDLEWEIVCDCGAKMTSGRNLSTDILAVKPKGSVIIAQKENDWVVPAHEPGFTKIEVDSQLILKPRSVSYARLSRSACADMGWFPIHDQHVCQAAAFTLGYFDTKVEHYHGVDPRPDGCYLKDGELWMASGTPDWNKDGRGKGEPLCSSRSSPGGKAGVATAAPTPPATAAPPTVATTMAAAAAGAQTSTTSTSAATTSTVTKTTTSAATTSTRPTTPSTTAPTTSTLTKTTTLAKTTTLTKTARATVATTSTHTHATTTTHTLPPSTTTHTLLPSTTTTTTWGWPSLFCFCVATASAANEVVLVKGQLHRRMGIFSCDQFTVFSNAGKIDLGYGWITAEVDTRDRQRLGHGFKDGETTSSWLNTIVFIKAWTLVGYDGRYKDHDWTVKVDPDAVFFPERLRTVVRHHTPRTGKGENVFYLNCDMYGPDSMYGSLEVISHQAAVTFFAGRDRCEENLNWTGWGEDYYLQKCLIYLGVKTVTNFSMIGDFRCHGAPCTDQSKVVFHDYKVPKVHFGCWEQSVAGKVEK